MATNNISEVKAEAEKLKQSIDAIDSKEMSLRMERAAYLGRRPGDKRIAEIDKSLADLSKKDNRKELQKQIDDVHSILNVEKSRKVGKK